METAEQAGLDYTSDEQPGIRRLKKGKGFTYVYPHGDTVKDKTTLTRIRTLAIPPAYRDVWICSDPRGHLQFTGIDARGRKQYRYHADWSAIRDQVKFDRVAEFARKLPAIREQLDKDLRRSELDRRRVLAIAVYLLEKTLVRVGNDQYTRENGSYGLTTLRARHASVTGTEIRFKFRGKSGVVHDVSLRDRRLARIMRQLQELPGQELFTYRLADGGQSVISSHDVNQYLSEISEGTFTAKDFRTWAATLMAFSEFSQCEECEVKTTLKHEVTRIVKKVAQRLGNTPTVCRKSYIHTRVLETAAGHLPIKCRPANDPEKALIKFLSEQSTA